MMINWLRRQLGLCVHVWGPWRTSSRALPLVPDIDPATGEVTDRGYITFTIASRRCTLCPKVRQEVLR